MFADISTGQKTRCSSNEHLRNVMAQGGRHVLHGFDTYELHPGLVVGAA